MSNATLDRSEYAATTVVHTWITTVVLHCPALCNESHKRQNNKRQGHHAKMGGMGTDKVEQKSTCFHDSGRAAYRLSPNLGETTNSSQGWVISLKHPDLYCAQIIRSGNRKPNIASLHSAKSSRRDGKTDQITQIERPPWKGGHTQKTEDVTSASLIPNLLKNPNEGTVSVLVMTMQICGPASTPMPPPFDPSAHSCIAYASATRILDFPVIPSETHRGRTMGVETSTVLLYVLDHRVGQLIATVRSAT